MNEYAVDIPCQCPNAGWCERHKRKKTGRIYELCQTRSDYRRLWDNEEIRASLNKSQPIVVNSAMSTDNGPGSILAKFYGRFGIKKTSGCSCSSLEKQMNAWGPQGCRDNIEHIINTIELEARKRSLHIGSTLTRKLIKHSVLLAIAKAERYPQK